MSNVFKEIEGDDRLPEEVKKQTLSNLHNLRLIMEVVDLFVVKAAATFTSSLGEQTDPSETSSSR